MIKTQCTNPIFIIGCPRSGTTLLATLLNRHSQIASSTETHFFNFVSKRNYNWKEFTLTSFTRIIEESRIKDFISHAAINKERLIKAFKQDPQSKYQSRLEIDQFYKKEVFDLLMNSFLAAKSKLRLCESTPQHLQNIQEILELYPQAKFIHLIRDGRDTTSSLTRMPWRPNGLLNNSRFWVQNLKKASKIITKLGKDSTSIMELRYEELVLNPEESLQKVCKFINEDFEPALLDDSKQEQIIYSSWESTWKQKTREKIDPGSIGCWRKELDEDEQAILNWYLRDILTGLGYESVKQKLKLRQWFKLGFEYLIITWRKLIRIVLNLVNSL